MSKIPWYLPGVLWYLSGILWVLSVIPLIIYPGIVVGSIMAFCAIGAWWAPGIDGFFISVFLWGTMLYPLAWLVALSLRSGAGSERSKERAFFSALPAMYILLLIAFPAFGWLISDFTPESRAVPYPPLEYQLDQEHVIQRTCLLVPAERWGRGHKGIYYHLYDNSQQNTSSRTEISIPPGTKIQLSAVKRFHTDEGGSWIGALGKIELPSTGAVEFLYFWSTGYRTLSRAPWEPDSVTAKRRWKDLYELEHQPGGMAIEAIPE